MKNMKVALFVYDISLTGGAEHVAMNLASEFSEIYKTYLISIFDQKHICDGVYPYEMQVLSKQNISITINLMKLSSRLRRYIRQNEIDVLIAITAGVVTVADLAAVNTDTKVIYAEHSNLENRTYGKKHQLRQFIGAKFSDIVVTLTERDKVNFEKIFKIRKEKIYVIPNWYTPNTNINEKNKSLSKNIISVGRLEKVKGYHYLLEVAKKIYPYFPDWKWDIYGEGSLREELQRQIKSSGLSGFIELKGNVMELSKVYGNYSIYVMTSLYEGLPMSLLEAQAAGLPIISFDCPTGPAEIVENGVNGIIVQAYHIEEMVQAIKSLMEDVGLRDNYASKASINLHHFSKENIMKKWIELFKQISNN
jgi:glycosyltransferase involved in cell wall biosynthesis